MWKYNINRLEFQCTTCTYACGKRDMILSLAPKLGNGYVGCNLIKIHEYNRKILSSDMINVVYVDVPHDIFQSESALIDTNHVIKVEKYLRPHGITGGTTIFVYGSKR